VAIIQAREPARILKAIGNQQENRWHLELKQRGVEQYNFYRNDARWGRRFVRVCPYFPCSARVCLNQHYGLANRRRERGLGFRPCGHAFLSGSDPDALQPIADSLTANDLLACAQKWLPCFTPFFPPTERQQASCRHRLFFAQTEYCDTLIFRQRAALDRLGNGFWTPTVPWAAPTRSRSFSSARSLSGTRANSRAGSKTGTGPLQSGAAMMAMALSSSTFGILCGCGRNRPPTMGTITVGTRA